MSGVIHDCNKCQNFYIPDPLSEGSEEDMVQRCTLENGEELYYRLMFGDVTICPFFKLGRPKGLPQKDFELFPDWFYQLGPIEVVFRDVRSAKQAKFKIPSDANVRTIIPIVLKHLSVSAQGKKIMLKVVNQRTGYVYESLDYFSQTDTATGDVITLEY